MKSLLLTSLALFLSACATAYVPSPLAPGHPASADARAVPYVPPRPLLATTLDVRVTRRRPAAEPARTPPHPHEQHAPMDHPEPDEEEAGHAGHNGHEGHGGQR